VALEHLQGPGYRAVQGLGGLDLHVCFERYAEHLVDLSAALECEVFPPAGCTTPYLVKAVRSDGHMAWSSPIYIG
jgi:hypothetical protein